MKKQPQVLRILLIALLVIFIIAIVTSMNEPLPAQKQLGAAAFFAQATDPPQVEDQSEIGSTDGIVLMGVIIVLIVMVPILIRRKSWSDE